MKNGLVITRSDNVATVLEDVEPGDTVLARGLDALVTTVASAAIGRGHKIALVDIPAGTDIVKYGFAIGYATVDIGKGSPVHVHNVGSKTTEE